MFDPVTRRFLATAPSLPELPATRFADELTAMYVEIAAMRLATRRVSPEVEPGEDVAGDLTDIVPQADRRSSDLADRADRMARIADVLEAQVILKPFGDETRAAAYVAGSARQAFAQAAALLSSPARTRVDVEAISADIAAALLFLISERTADAFEASRAIRPPSQQGVRRQIAVAIANLARGRLAPLAALDIEPFRPTANELTSESAANLLYFRILEGAVMLATDCLGRAEAPMLEQAQALFREVRELAVDIEEAETVPGTDFISNAPSTFPGPHHLAALLERATSLFRTAAVVRLPDPGGVDSSIWRPWLIGEAERFPFVWENHRRAIDTGYLDVGRSLIMTSPTGSGKTTLATLKIAATLSSGRSVVYLAPTHALVGQVERDLNERLASLANATSVEDALLEEIGQRLPDLAVLTPERCFALLTFAPDLFANVGLLVFDECHLMGVAKPGVDGAAPARFDRRSIDAMLCLLSFVAINQSADYLLLSAMVANAGDLAAWLPTITGRPCEAFDDKWKPTRQLRTCLLYDQVEMAAVNGALAADFAGRTPPPKTVPVAAKAIAQASPVGLFSIGMGWHPEDPTTLALRPLSDTALPLGVAKRRYGWGVTANRNEVAAKLAVGFAETGQRVIVFCESVTATGSVAKIVNAALGARPTEATQQQAAWAAKAREDIGSEAAGYFAGAAPAAVHHGELTPEERLLAESAFRDPKSAVTVLAATSTIAQGLNLPCDVVILAGTDRVDDSDPTETVREDLLAHEILNALGRAGRAGLSANGLALVVPAVPLTCDATGVRPPDHDLLRTVFSDGDQCLPLKDPITNLYDHIVVHGAGGDEAAYLMKRLAVSLGDAKDGVETFDALTRRSLGYFLKARVNAAAAEVWLAERRGQLERLIEQAREDPVKDWMTELAAKSGASAAFIEHLATVYGTAPTTSGSAQAWMTWLINQLPVDNADFDTFLRPDTLERVFGRGYAGITDDKVRRERGRMALLKVLPTWFAPASLTALEQDIVAFIVAHEGPVKRSTSPHAKLKHARRFALRLAPDLSYLAGVLTQVARKVAEDGGVEPLAITQSLPQLIRKGFDTAYHLFLDRQETGRSRIAVHNEFVTLSPLIDIDPADDWAAVRSKVEDAVIDGLFDDFTDLVIEVPATPPLLVGQPGAASPDAAPLALPPPSNPDDQE
ncbi:ski2-like helicase [Brevundimonas diminuta]|uniref:Ski2-like helicase n=1 Tax=Brevundimonas diminuta TaxID=293 RepID=A0A2X1AXR3_BREDI|nr:DEAD/DEAH box helicase [Brevundimonas diminuta]SPU44394.1 ski2-like helicase [Brevundimonas diminuta]SPU45372.1 ski2-like helicase [Brevundimonas diminuta]